MSLAARAVVGALVAVAIASAAYRARSLSASGSAVAVIMGTVAAAAGTHWAVVLVLYFVSSSILSRVGKRKKVERTAGMIEKAGPRDARQVASNGLVFGLAAAASSLGMAPSETCLVIGAGALAASAADTWATEIGTLIGGRPRSILSWKSLPIGASGGITIAGTLASIAGAAFVAVTAIGATLTSRAFPWIVAGGILGSISDSIAGAFLQRRLWCDACGSTTEMAIHACGTPTRRVGGLSFVENDLVNLMATIVGAGASALLAGAFA